MQCTFRKLILISLLLASPAAEAYLDPSTGSMVISAIVGLIASIALAVKTYWYRIKRYFRRTDSGTESAPEDPGS